MITVLTVEDVNAREQQTHAAIQQLAEQVAALKAEVDALKPAAKK